MLSSSKGGDTMEMQDVIFIGWCVILHCIGLMMLDPNARVGLRFIYNLIRWR